MVRLKPDMEADYRRLHAEVWPGVLETLRRANVHNYLDFFSAMGCYLAIWSTPARTTPATWRP